MKGKRLFYKADGHKLIDKAFDELSTKDGGEVRGVIVFILGDNGIQAGQEGGISLECIQIIRQICDNAEVQLHNYLAKNN